ncbi:uncharacterized protein LOC122245019 [Penaeus japonicus]|uniref:uncharacterized protein LOC122245019 n=1 Tax=Penaeus japonicus TaxID=27405 RepID=UPI001C70CDDA|nr:uncharacterized protein LOC122245019 [Penaeus japonicus]
MAAVTTTRKVMKSMIITALRTTRIIQMTITKKEIMKRTIQMTITKEIMKRTMQMTITKKEIMKRTIQMAITKKEIMKRTIQMAITKMEIIIKGATRTIQMAITLPIAMAASLSHDCTSMRNDLVWDRRYMQYT